METYYIEEFDMTIEASLGGGTISSNLNTLLEQKEADALESFILAAVCQGVDINTITSALQTTLDAIGNNDWDE